MAQWIVLDWTYRQHGGPARLSYERLIVRALKAITVSRDPIGSRVLDEVTPGVRLYHLRNSKRASDRPLVRNPGHFLVCERPEPDLVIVLRLLHDAIDLPSRLQDEG